MRLFEHPDFEQAILRAAEHFRGRGLRPAIIEKDYYVTEALRIIAAAAGDKVIFKGGTSLSKGWNLIQRFSEDIDIFLDPRRLRAAARQEGHRPRAEEAARRRRQAPGPDLPRRGEPDHRRLRAQRPVLVRAALRRPGRGRQPRAARSRHRQRPRAHRRSSNCGRTSASSLRRAGVSLGAEDEGCLPAAPAPFPPHVRREDVRHPQQGRAAQARRAAARRLRPPLLRPLPAGRAAGGPRHAAVGRVRRHQGRLRPDQPDAFREELLLPRRA